jgi:hypothetical protein
MMIGSSMLGVNVYGCRAVDLLPHSILPRGHRSSWFPGSFFNLNLMVEQAITGRRKLTTSRRRKRKHCRGSAEELTCVHRCDYERLLNAADLDPTDNRLRVLEVIGNNSYPLSAADIYQTLERLQPHQPGDRLSNSGPAGIEKPGGSHQHRRSCILLWHGPQRKPSPPSPFLLQMLRPDGLFDAGQPERG